MQILFDEHAQIRALTARIRTLVEQPAPDVAEFGKLRVQLSRALIAHFVSEEEFVNVPLRKDSKMSSELTAWNANLQDLREKYSEHVREWPLNVALHNWSQYRAAVLARVEEMEARMLLEERQIYPRAFHASAQPN